MKETAGRIINYVKENEPVKGCTISNQIYQDLEKGIFIFSLAANTGITAESYDYYKLITVLSGEMNVVDLTETKAHLLKGESILTEKNTPIGMETKEGCVYMEIALPKEVNMNEIINAGEVFKLAELLPYQEGKIVNMDLASNENMKFVVMSFDEGTGLSEHAAPGEALVFALDGEAVIGYEGKDYEIHAGETFKFDKMGRHAVTAKGRFKMALLLILDK